MKTKDHAEADGIEPDPDLVPAQAPRDPTPRQPLTGVPLTATMDEQAMIEEARRRQRRRHRWIAIIVLATLVGIGTGLGVSIGSRGPATQIRAPARSSVPTPSSSIQAELNRPEALAVASNGNVLIANQGTSQILRRTPDGKLEVVAGTGRAGFRGDGGPATKAELDDPDGMAVAPNGTIYVADTGNNRVRAISPSGTISTVAGNGGSGSGGSGGPAVRAQVDHPVAVALDAQGRLYIVDSAGLQVSSDGILTTVVAAGPGVLAIDGAHIAFIPSAVAVDNAENLYVANSSPKLLIELTPGGRVLRTWQTYVAQAGLTAAPDGSVLVADYGRFAVDRGVSDQLAPIVTFRLNSLPGLSGTFTPSGIAVSDAGAIYADTDGVNGGTNQPALAAVTTQGQVQLLKTGPNSAH